MPEHDESRASWVARRCSGPLWTLNRIVPAGFEKYLRICHPGWRWQPVTRTAEQAASVDDYEEMKRATPDRWCDVAREQGKPVHREMQWGQVAPPPADTRKGEGGLTPPLEGETTPDILDGVFNVLIRHSGKDQACVCAFWEGFGKFDQTDAMRIDGMGQGTHCLMSAQLEAIWTHWRGVLAESIDHSGYTPQAIWPTSEEWFFAVPFELHSSFFGGPNDMASEIGRSTLLETYEVFAGDTFLGQKTNRSP